MYGKQTETAIAAVSYLAALWEGPTTRRVSAADIADGRGLQRPFVAKLLSSLSQAGIVSGSPGPGGGYALAKDPREICLRDVWAIFERPESSRVGFVGSEICGVSVPNGLSDRIGRVEQAQRIVPMILTLLTQPSHLELEHQKLVDRTVFKPNRLCAN